VCHVLNFRLELEYDKRNRIKTQQFLIGRTSSMDRITYNADGHVMEAVGSGANNWKFVYDENGNVIGAIDQGHKQSLGYDLGDRVVQVGDVELINYDSRGFVIRRGEQKYRYNPRGQLTHAFEREKFSAWYAYDDRGRMVSWRDAQDNITQLLYAYPHTPELVSHVHFPQTGRTFRLLYDDRKFLIAVETSEQRFYVACDQNGSPLALFDINGNIIKEVRKLFTIELSLFCPLECNQFMFASLSRSVVHHLEKCKWTQTQISTYLWISTVVSWTPILN